MFTVCFVAHIRSSFVRMQGSVRIFARDLLQPFDKLIFKLKKPPQWETN